MYGYTNQLLDFIKLHGFNASYTNVVSRLMAMGASISCHLDICTVLSSGEMLALENCEPFCCSFCKTDLSKTSEQEVRYCVPLRPASLSSGTTVPLQPHKTWHGDNSEI